MNEDRAKSLLRFWRVTSNGELTAGTFENRGLVFPSARSPVEASLGGTFTADELEAIAWMMRNQSS